MNTKKISLKDSKIKELYNIRLSIFENTKKVYQLQKSFFRATIIDANMKRVHLDSMIPQIDHLITLQKKQIDQIYSIDQEKEINLLAEKVNGGDWTSDEKQLLLSRCNDINKIQTKISTLTEKIEKDGKLLMEYQGEEIIGTFEENEISRCADCS